MTNVCCIFGIVSFPAQVTDDGAAEGEEDEDEAAPVGLQVEEEEEKQVTIPASAPSSISLVVAIDPADPSPRDVLLVDEAVHPHHHSSRVEPTPPATLPLLSTPSRLVDSGDLSPESASPDLPAASAAPSPAGENPVPDIISSSGSSSSQGCDDAISPPPVLGVTEKEEEEEEGQISSPEHCISFVPESSSALADPPETLEPPVFCSTPSFPLLASCESSLPSSIPSLHEPVSSSTAIFVIPPQVKEEEEEFKSSLKATDAAVLFAAQLLSELLPVQVKAEQAETGDHPAGDCPPPNDEEVKSEAGSCSSVTDSIEEDSLDKKTGQRVQEEVEENGPRDIDRDSLDDDEERTSSSDDFVYLQMDDEEMLLKNGEEGDTSPDVYFEDDEPEGMVLCGSDDPPPGDPPVMQQPQLWRTVILEESEPNSKEMSPLLCSDSGIGAGTPSPTPIANECPSEDDATAAAPTTSTKAETGPITKAVSLWLESAPIQQQLIASSSSVAFVEDADDMDEDDDDLYFHHQEVEEEEEEEAVKKAAVTSTTTVPKNGVATLRTAPFSDDRVTTDGPAMRRVGSDSALAMDSTDLSGELLQDEPAASELLTQTCDPAKFSVYYQLGVSVDHDDSGIDGVDDGKVEAHLIADPVKSTTLDDSIQQCSLGDSCSSLLSPGEGVSPAKKKKSKKKTTPAQLEEAATKKKKKKRGSSWRRVLLLHRAVHNMSRSDDKTSTAATTPTTPTNTRRLKSGSQSCCALQ